MTLNWSQWNSARSPSVLCIPQASEIPPIYSAFLTFPLWVFSQFDAWLHDFEPANKYLFFIQMTAGLWTQMKMQYKCHCPNLFFYMSCFEDADVLLLNVALNPLTHSLWCGASDVTSFLCFEWLTWRIVLRWQGLGLMWPDLFVKKWQGRRLRLLVVYLVFVRWTGHLAVRFIFASSFISPSSEIDVKIYITI